MNPRDQERNCLNPNITKIILLAKDIRRKKNPDAKAAVDKEWKKFETIPAWKLEKVQSKKEFVLEAQRDKKKVHFATLSPEKRGRLLHGVLVIMVGLHVFFSLNRFFGGGTPVDDVLEDRLFHRG